MDFFNENTENNEQKQVNNNVKDFGVDKIPTKAEKFYILPIIGQIEGHRASPPQTKTTKYEHLIPQLMAIETNDSIEGVITILNTVGGDVEAGLAISEMIRSLSKPTVSIVIGGGHSIGVPLATSANYSFISPTATMIIHPIRMNGMVLGVPHTFHYFDKMQERIVEFVTRNSNISNEKFKDFMHQTNELLNDMGTILIGKQAVDCGLIDGVGGISDAVKKLEELVENNKKA